MTVMLVMLDGVRPDALAQANCPYLDAFKQRSAYTLCASSVMPSITLPCHTSIFHSVPPTRHGILANHWTPMARPVPGLFDVAHTAGLRCAAFYGWEQLRDVSRAGHMTLSVCLNTAEADYQNDHHIVTEAIRHLTTAAYDFAFVYFGTVDTAGHAHGWMSPGYLAQLEQVDQEFGRLLDALSTETTVLVQSDHGGHDRSHGTDSPEDMTIPWLIAGPHIRPNHKIQMPVSLLDTAPTLAYVLDINAPPQWEGQVIQEAFA